jgi:ATP-dependent RNA helicase DeaD
VEERPRRHSKPSVSTNGAQADEAAFARLMAGAGSADGLGVADLVGAVTREAGVDGEAVRDVRVLERFAFLSVPEADAARIADAVSGARVSGVTLKLERT